MGERRRAAGAAACRAPGWSGLLAALGLLGGCSDQSKLRESDLTQLVAWLPGTYESVPQTEQGAGGVRPPHEHIQLVVVRVLAQRLGHNAFYVQEMAADDPRRVMSERMFSFKVDEKRGIVESVYTFVEPLRWRDGQQNPVLFSGLESDDVKSGCELLWKKGAGRFTAVYDGQHCRQPGATPPAEPAAELSAEFFTFGGYQYRKKG
jgi:CpeT/CpcT family protein DUF1001